MTLQRHQHRLIYNRQNCRLPPVQAFCQFCFARLNLELCHTTRQKVLSRLAYGRIVVVADVYDALMISRFYARGA